MSTIEKDKLCQCAVDGFFMTNRQTSIICSLLILLFMMTFISGYFWGHGRATKEFTEKLVDDSFTDKINYAFSNFEKSSAEPENETETPEDDFEESENDNQTSVTIKDPETTTEIQNVPLEVESDKFYYAELIGFATMSAAQQFAQRALQHGYNVDIRQRVSKTAKGKLIYWFQAVTEKLNNKEQLMDLVAKIQKTEKIKDVKIIEEKKN